MILYFCPDLLVPSAGIRRLYDHVHLLSQAGHEAAILHASSSFRRHDLAPCPIRGGDQPDAIRRGDIIVIPEGFPGLMEKLKDAPVRRFVICLNWAYVYQSLAERVDWRHFHIERIIGDSPFTTEMISWAMSLPCHVITNSLNEELYFRETPFGQKRRKIVFIKRKGELVPQLLSVLHSRNPAFIDQFKWVALDGLAEADFAGHVREAAIFLNLSLAEGLAQACFEAMRSETLLCGFNSIGGQRVFVGEGERQNAVLAETGDYLSLARNMEPLLNDLLLGQGERWRPVIDQAYNDTMHMTVDNERRELLAFWEQMLSPST